MVCFVSSRESVKQRWVTSLILSFFPCDGRTYRRSQLTLTESKDLISQLETGSFVSSPMEDPLDQGSASVNDLEKQMFVYSHFNTLSFRSLVYKFCAASAQTTISHCMQVHPTVTECEALAINNGISPHTCQSSFLLVDPQLIRHSFTGSSVYPRLTSVGSTNHLNVLHSPLFARIESTYCFSVVAMGK